MAAFERPVSIEIGTHAVKVARVTEGRGRVRVIRFAEQALPAEYVWEMGGEAGPLVKAIREALIKARIRSRRAIMSVPRRQVTARISAFPSAPEAELRRVVEYDLADHIPFPVEQVVVDIQPLGASREERGLTDVLVVAAQRDLVREYLRVAEAVGLETIALTVDALALDDLARLAGREPVGLTVAVEIGARATTINISQGERLELTRSVGVGGERLTRAVQEDLGLDYDGAERRKRADGLRLLGQEPRPSRVAAWLDNLLGEIRRSALSFGPAAVSRILLAGAGSAVPGLREALRAEFGVEPARLSASEVFPETDLRGESVEAADRCLLAIGQGLRSVGRSRWTISLLPREVLEARRARRLRRAGVMAAVLVVAGMAGGYVRASHAIEERQAGVADLRGRAEEAEKQRASAEKLLAERDRFREQLGALGPTRLRQHLALELLRSIALYAPEDVVLSHFMVRPDQSVDIRGTVSSPAVAVDLQHLLSSSRLVRDVKITSVSVYGRGRQGSRRGEAVSFNMHVELWRRRERESGATVFSPWGGAR